MSVLVHQMQLMECKIGLKNL